MSDELDAAIAERMPGAWARANDPTRRCRSKARSNLRKRYRAMLAREAFIAENPRACCTNCTNSSIHQQFGLVCDLDSDFHGYLRVALDHVCVRWGAL